MKSLWSLMESFDTDGASDAIGGAIQALPRVLRQEYLGHYRGDISEAVDDLAHASFAVAHGLFGGALSPTLDSAPPAVARAALLWVVGKCTPGQSRGALSALARVPGGVDELRDLGTREPALAPYVDEALMVEKALGGEFPGQPPVEAVTLPPYTPLPDEVSPALFMEALHQDLMWRTAEPPRSEGQKRLVAEIARMTARDWEMLADIACGRGTVVPDLPEVVGYATHAGREVLSLAGHMRLEVADVSRDKHPHPRTFGVDRWIDPDTDLRVLRDAVLAANAPLWVVTRHAVNGYPGVEPSAAWPFFWEHPAQLRDLLQGDAQDQEYAIRVLAQMPAIPAWTVPHLGAAALGTRKRARALAQHMLDPHPGASALALAALRSRKPTVRVIGAQWLQERQEVGSVADLTDALAGERNARARKAMMSAIDAVTASA
ncbi:hypothetical protein ON058_03055 [Demequina sp. B12]|uniref:hypothetical protein n=1 Tax=Demequina sp. B12 TaxID=2992757 RepID=UPI00237BF470|nr:hypothetical protein [Demequina sp. B12]MDE0572389.1 hypothetical protein [Demequina sp. B12]